MQNYDPYLNTYNYPYNSSDPYNLASDGDNQMPDSRYEDGGYGDPNMSYSNAYDNTGAQYSFKEGGSVGDEDLPKLADLIRRYGRNGDTELAHINPIEAQILKSLGGSGTINPATGLREYSFWTNPGKATRSFFSKPKRALAETLAIGSAIFGGPAGSAAGHAAKEAILGRKPKDILMGALKGAGYGTAVPMAANLAGQGLSALGANSLGSTLQNYATNNMGSWFGNMAQAGEGVRGLSSSLGFGNPMNLFGNANGVNAGNMTSYSPYSFLSQGMGGGGRGQGLGVSSGDYAENYYNYMLDRQKKQDNMGFTDKLQDYLTEPKNLLTLGTTAAQYLGREKPKSPEKIAEEERRYRNASRKTIAEVEADEALETARADLQKKRKNKQLEEDIKNMGSVHRRVVSPEEFARTGRWIEYTDDDGRPIRMKGGGSINSQETRSEIINKGKQLTDDIITKNLQQNNGKLDERSLIGEFSNLTRVLRLNEAEKNVLEKYSEGLFKNLQFIDDPGYFYRQTHNIPQMKRGGSMHSPYAYLTRETYYPTSPISYLSGDSGGQDDLIDAKLSDGEYVFDASTVSDLGDGNNAAGARKLDIFRENIRRHKRGGKVNLPPRAKSLESYLRG